MKNPTTIPAQLWEGNKQILEAEVDLFLQKQFCSKPTNNEKAQAACFCKECQKIKQRQHAFALWISPEKNYSVDDIAIIFDKIRFSLEQDQSFFFILEKANTLNLACANRLLKILEEPPRGYNFILLTNNANLILPTIKSRSFIKTFENNKIEDHPILSYFTESNKNFDPNSFISELKSFNLTDNETIEILNIMLQTFTNKLISLYNSNKKDKIKELTQLKKIISFLKIQMLTPPQSGSSNIFWKNFYISFPHK